MRTRAEEVFRYLLDELNVFEAQAFEDDVFADDTRFEEVCAFEDELIDAYVRGQLSRERRRRFEFKYLGTSAGNLRVVTAKAINARFRRASWKQRLFGRS